MQLAKILYMLMRNIETINTNLKGKNNYNIKGKHLQRSCGLLKSSDVLKK